MAELSRIDKIKHLRLAFVNGDDKHIVDMYDIFTKDFEDNNKAKNKLCRHRMVNFMLNNLQCIKNDTINNIYQYGEDHNLHDDNGVFYVRTEKKKNINDDPYTITLYMANCLLGAIDHEKIDRLEEFQNMKRDLFETDACKKVFEDNIDYIKKQFTSNDIKYNTRHNQRAYGVSALKHMVDKLDNYVFVSRMHKNKKVVSDGDKANYTTYSINMLDR